MSNRLLPLSKDEKDSLFAVKTFLDVTFKTVHSREDIVNQFNAHQNEYFVSGIFLREHFTEVIGIPPMEYVRQLRLNKGKEMLLDRDKVYSIKQIAEEVGLTPTSFITFFKREIGIPPGQYRKDNWKALTPEWKAN